MMIVYFFQTSLHPEDDDSVLLSNITLNHVNLCSIKSQMTVIPFVLFTGLHSFMIIVKSYLFSAAVDMYHTVICIMITNIIGRSSST